MRIIAVLEVDEEKLMQTGHSFEEEMGWAVPSGITLKDYINAQECSVFEYAAFAWNTERQEYDQIGYSTTTELLCRKRFQERVRKGWIPSHIDAANVVFKKRPVSEIYGRWTELEQVRQ
jgi:hypothetical protein